MKFLYFFVIIIIRNELICITIKYQENIHRT